MPEWLVLYHRNGSDPKLVTNSNSNHDVTLEVTCFHRLFSLFLSSLRRTICHPHSQTRSGLENDA